MGNESTAIHDLLAGFGRKAIADDPDDDILFAGSRRREEAPKAALPRPNGPRAGMFTLPPPPPPPPMMIPAAGTPMAGAPAIAPYAAPARVAAGTQPPPVTGPIVMTAPAAPTIQMNVGLAQQTIVPLPHAFQRNPAYALDGGGTVRGSRFALGTNKRMYGLAAGLFAIVVVLVTVLVTGDDKKPTKVAAATPAKVASVEVQPIEAPTEATAAPTAAAAPIEAPVAAPAPEPIAAEPTVPVAEPALSKDLIAPPEVVPASAFTAKHESTLGGATLTATPIEAPPPPVETLAAASDDVESAPVAKAPVAKKKSRRELAREKRAAKRAAKRDRTKRVASVEKPAAKSKTENLGGNGALAITSAQPREVWVDGRNSKRSTPLRVLLKPGKHTVTLFDKSNGTAKTFSVDIKADSTTKVAK